MDAQRPQVLIVEDEIDLLDYYVLELEEDNDYDVHTAQTVKEAQTKLKSLAYDVVLTDLKLRAASQGGLVILEEAKKAHPDTQVIIFTGIGGTDDARQAERLMVDGYLTKPLDFERVRQVVKNAIEVRRQRVLARNKVRHIREIHLPTPERFVYACGVMCKLVNMAAQLSSTSSNILIIGEPGTGKGLLAEGIHFGSGRTAFDLVNCGSLSERTLEQIIFGYYSDVAQSCGSGLLERLSGGTLVLDGVSGLSLRLQERLLAALSKGEYQVHDSLTPVLVDVRIISINQFDLSSSVEQGLFLSDLFEKLAQEQLTVPPVRERQDPDGRYNDVLMLTDYFIKKYGRMIYGEDTPPPVLASETEQVIETYPFPGNVRELEQVIRVTLRNLRGDTILSTHLPPYMQRYGGRSTLGITTEEVGASVRCPHGSFHCNQTDLIAAVHQGRIGVYVRLSPEMPPDIVTTVQEQVERLGAVALYPQIPQDTQVPMCEVCVPIQSSQFAIVDISDADENIFYELGILHALGAQVLVLKNNTSAMPARWSAESVLVYAHIDEMIELVGHWLSEMKIIQQ